MGKTCITQVGEERPLGRTKSWWEDNIKTDLTGIGSGGMDWIHLDQNMDQWKALVNTVMNFRIFTIFRKLLRS
jgi:hypothetical protein